MNIHGKKMTNVTIQNSILITLLSYYLKLHNLKVILTVNSSLKLGTAKLNRLFDQININSLDMPA